MNGLNVDKPGLIRKLKEMNISNMLESRVLGEVYFMLSLQCNLKCKVCSWWGLKGPCRNKNFLKKYASTLKIKELMRFADEIIQFSPQRVTFSGGEPLLYDKWYRLAEFFKEKKVKVSLTTNGVFLFDNFDRVVEAVDEINLSLGGPPAILPFIREDNPEHFKLIMKGLKKLAAFKKKNKNKPNLRILYTISNLSYDHMEELITFMRIKDINIDHYHFQHLMFIDENTFELQKKLLRREFNTDKLDLWKGYTYFPEDFDFLKFKDEIERVKKFGNVSFSPNLYADEIEPYYRCDRQSLHYNMYCTAPWHQIDIMPNGDIYTCHDLFIGNLKEKTFNEIWNGGVSKKLRAYLMKSLFPGCKGCFYHYCERSE